MPTKRTTLCLLLLCVIGVLAYYPILGNQLLDFWDDQWVVMNFYTEGGFNPQNLWAILTEFYHGQYAPFNELLYLILYSLFGYNALAFHLASLLLHVANAIMVFLLVKKLLLLNSSTRGFDAKAQELIAMFTAMFFLVHPLNVESVAWMSASKVLVYAFFYLLASHAFIAYMQRGKLKFYFLTLVLFLFSFFGKEQAVTFPLWLVLLYLIAGFKITDTRLWKAIAPMFALSLLFGVLTMLSQSANGEGVLTQQSSYPLWQRMVYACYAFTEYLIKCVFPFKLLYIYPFPSVVGDPLPTWLLLYPCMLMVMAFTLWKFIARGPVLIGLAFFTIHIAVALHIIPLSRFAVVADRYAYIATIGVGFTIGYYVVLLYGTLSKGRKILLYTALLAYLLYFGIYTNIRSRVWYNVDSLKKELRDILIKRPDYIDNNK